MRPINPYIVGNPIKDQASFFGRQDIFREVLQVLRQRGSNAIVLYGQRRIGKTSVLLQLEKQLAHDGEFTPVYFDLQDKAAKSLSEVLYELSQHISKVTGHAVAKASDFDRNGDYFRSVFLPGIAQKAGAGGLVLLFDEFDVLDSPMQTQASEAFFPYLRLWMTDVQKVKFVFVIGRRPEDLSVRTMSTFKGIQSTRVSFLSRKAAEEVVLQSEKDNSLKWDDSGVQRALDLTHGHPYFTQLLCSVVWENAHENGPSDVPIVSAKQVEASVSQALKFGANAFNWIWDGLPPAERVVVAAMAEVPEEIITQDKLIETLNQSGVRLVARELELAPETLIDWEVLVESNGAYRFTVPLLRRWVLANRPLRRVKEELDRLNPLADTLFQGGQGFYNSNDPEGAEQQLRQALNINPNHLKARLLLGQVLLEKRNFAESVAMFDAAYQYDERSARAHLIKALLALAETQEENLQLSTYERILKIQSDQPLANEKIQAIWVKRGEALQAQENFEEALKAFEQIGDTDRIEKVRHLMHEKKLALDMQRAEAYEKASQWKSALDTLLQLTSDYPDSETLRSRVKNARANWHAESMDSLKAAEQEEDWEKVLAICDDLGKEFADDLEIKSYADRARIQMGLTQKYHEALGALQSGHNDQARQILSQVLADNPQHLQAAHKLIEATYGKVNITRPTPWAVWIPVGLTTLVWILLAALVVNAFLFVSIFTRLPKIPIEALIVVAVVVVALIAIGVTLYVSRVLDAAFRVDVRGRPSMSRALWTHFPLGLGLFHVDHQARRRWLYPLVAMIFPLLLISGPFLTKEAFLHTKNYNPAFFDYYEGPVHKSSLYLASVENGSEGAWQMALGIFTGIYLLSFVDVIGTCYVRRRTNRATKVFHRPMISRAAAPVSQEVVTGQTPAPEMVRESGDTKNPVLPRLKLWVRTRNAKDVLAVLSLLLVLVISLTGTILKYASDLVDALWLLLGLVLVIAWIVALLISSKFAMRIKQWLPTKSGRIKAVLPEQSLEPTNPDVNPSQITRGPKP
jgi:tetratricopeptide (TPR) repeat protein